jgi:hypothetical protein
MKNTTKPSGKNHQMSIKIRDLKPSKGAAVRGGACAKGEHLKEATITP